MKKSLHETWFDCLHLPPPLPPSPPHYPHVVFGSLCFQYSLWSFSYKKYKWTQTMERDGPDEARKTLMFIRQSLNRFHRCQSGKVTVTAPIKENGQYGNKRTEWKSALHNNISLLTDYWRLQPRKEVVTWTVCVVKVKMYLHTGWCDVLTHIGK